MTVISTDHEAQLEALFAPRVWTPELFAEFWAAPSLRHVRTIITDDVIGVWPGGQVVSGAEAYVKALENLLTIVPDLRLEVPESAMNGRFGFSRWVMHGTGTKGPFTMDGMDRTQVRDGLVCGNYVFFDSARFQAFVGA